PLLYLVALLVLWGIMFFLAFSRMSRRTISLPTESLMSVTESIHKGNFDSHVVPPNDYEETVQIIDAFNKLISEISELRIGIYEKQIQAREFELKALKNQVAPHFLINCLNTIFMSSQNPARAEMTNQIITTLSSHLRYTLSDRSIVPLSEELEYLENYILLTQYRYPGTLSYELEAGKDVMEAEVFPLILLTLTENSIKTGLIMDEPFLIRVQAEIAEKEGEPFVRLVHTDSGTGLSEENLEKYNHIFDHPEVTEKGTGIGLYNTALRLKLLLGERGTMRFWNEEGMGLAVEITFPYKKYEEPPEEALAMN
ncbi:MAG: histidine kinase, partial [Lachnospiraceae bacterium]|nr:histidine kinase [Lachnospiraceae bacterium]